MPDCSNNTYSAYVPGAVKHDPAINPSAVDIIIPAHCAASTLADCLDSVLAQTFRDWRAIIILNQSGYDASMGIAGKYSGADPRIRTEYLTRGDLSSAVNYGLSIASAPYIAMLDADDMYDPRFLECALTAIRNFGADLAITDVERFGEADELHSAIEANAHRALDIEMLHGKDKFTFMLDNPISGVLRSNRVYARKVLEGVWYPSGRVHEDEYAIYEVMRNAEKAAHIKAPLYYYRKTAGSITSASNPRELLDAVRALSHRIHAAAQYGDTQIVSAALKQCAMDVCFRYAQYDEAHRHDFRTAEALRIARVELKAYGRYLPALERMRLGFILAHPESVEKLVRRGGGQQ